MAQSKFEYVNCIVEPLTTITVSAVTAALGGGDDETSKGLGAKDSYLGFRNPTPSEV
jgi:hypothetical protein